MSSHNVPLPNEDLLPDPGHPTALDSVDYIVDPPVLDHDHESLQPPIDPETVTDGIEDTVAAALVDYAVPTLSATTPLLRNDPPVTHANVQSPSTQTAALSDNGSMTHPFVYSNLTTTGTMSEDAIYVANPLDVLSGRGAFVNTWEGNKKFRAICFARKAMFDAANPAAKQRIATDIWTTCVATYGSRYLKRHQEKGPWFEQPFQQAVLKAAQVMRDYRRPDRLISRESSTASSKKRNLASATPMDDVPLPFLPIQPIIENPTGVHEHDVICGRGAFVNGHTGNQRLRELGLARKAQFDAGSYATKRCLATEIVSLIRELTPAGRFLRKAKPSRPVEGDDNTIPPPIESDWEELDLEQSIHKACQVMRDIARQDRKERDERREARKLRHERRVDCSTDEEHKKHSTLLSEADDCIGPGGLNQDDPAEGATEEDIAEMEEAVTQSMLL